ncbi:MULTISPECIES: chemotaxis protein CheA [Thiorhodovibrio]|uniref:chemotaxis protein CheA n=1 Tax=Thiorhodovibrio TaxID=61593 RepID=UPI00191193F7|nr:MULTISPECIES: chemotaxis protein CheA [Thiorhodovibrio]MBK5971022.1 chemotaxis protein CheA [Thiorhodovibrio winogradskyi]WPL10611.1 Chemotaxis protein CheA [Thiorhodovibrio litoralis]
MAIDPNDEILQDFLVEAGELLEGLNEQLIDLEQEPDNRELLNAVFRSFHTIKGGAGFLSLDSMVAVCHRAEDIFNLLRNGEKRIDAFLMDTILRVLDVLNVMFNDIKSGQDPDPAPAALLGDLDKLAVPGDSSPPATASTPAAEPAAEAPPAASPEPAEQPTPPPVEQPEPKPEPAQEADAGESPLAAGGEMMTEAEYDHLLDAISSEHASAPPAAPKAPPAAPKAPPPPAAGGGDTITDDEFEALLDQLHGAGGPPKPVEAPPLVEPAPVDPALAELAPAEPDPAELPAVEAPPAQPSAQPAPQSASSATQPAPAQPKPAEAAAPPAQAAQPAAASAEAKPAADDSAAPAKAASRNAANPPAETSVRVDTHRLDEIMNLVGELVLVRNRLSMLRSQMGDDEVSKAIGSLALVTADLQTAVMKTRMQPVKKVFGRFPRVIRDLARNLGKEIDLETFGEETDLDKNLVEALADPLVHLVRNAVDHGIESPEDRVAKGKPRKGKVVLGAAQEGDHIALIIEDDGRGMDANVLRAKAVEKGLLDPMMAERMPDREAFNLIFMAGFSTKEQISDVSGRGVGMDVVKTRIAQLNGTVEIDSELGRGTSLQVRLPLTLAILPALMVILDGRRFAIPLASVSEILDLDLTKSHFVDDQETIMVRKHALPLVYVGRWVRPDAQITASAEAHVVVVHVGQRKVGLVVDGLVGQEEVVIKPLGLGLSGVPGLAGATITGDGGIALILDIPELMRTMGKGGLTSRGAHSRAVVAEI